MARHRVEYPREGRWKHDRIVDEVKNEFKARRYDVYDGLAVIKYLPELERILGKDRAKEYVNQGGEELYPDIVAIKGKEVLFVEVKTRSEEFVRQIANYSKLATKTILVVEAKGNLEIQSASNFRSRKN